jgi:hypothetical protein
MRGRKRLIVVKREGVSALRQFLSGVINGRNPDEVFNETKDQLIKVRVQFLSRTLRPNTVIAVKTTNKEVLLPDIIVGDFKTNKIEEVYIDDVYIGSLLVKTGSNTQMMNYISLDGSIFISCEATVYGARIGVLDKHGQVKSLLIIVKIKELTCT